MAYKLLQLIVVKRISCHQLGIRKRVRCSGHCVDKFLNQRGCF